jgi:CelD/BcsL family acetyltransferase involved in cellulose biosynthesis
VSHFLCLTEASKRGYEAYDFLVGEKRHKANLSTNANQLAWAVWRRSTLRNRAVQVLKTTKRLLKSRKPVSSSAEAAGDTAVSETTAGSH